MVLHLGTKIYWGNSYIDEVETLYWSKCDLSREEKYNATKEDVEKLKTFYDVLENEERIKNAWADLCYKYKVCDSQIMILTRNEGKKKTHFSKMGQSATFLGYNSNLSKKEYEDYGSSKSLPFADKIKRVFNVDEDKDLDKFRLFDIADYLNENEIYNKSKYNKTVSKGNDVLHIYANKKLNIAVVVLFKTKDRLTRGLLSSEINSIVKNQNKKGISINMYFWIRLVLFIIIEFMVFRYIGRKRKTREVIVDEQMD